MKAWDIEVVLTLLLGKSTKKKSTITCGLDCKMVEGDQFVKQRSFVRRNSRSVTFTVGAISKISLSATKSKLVISIVIVIVKVAQGGS